MVIPGRYPAPNEGKYGYSNLTLFETGVRNASAKLAVKILTGEPGLIGLVQLQIKNIFAGTAKDKETISQHFQRALIRTQHCFSATPDDIYYKIAGELTFNPFHTGQYSIFLYFLANEIWSVAPAEKITADKLYYLNKTLNGLDLFYEVRMPDVFFLDHPVGSVIGKAEFGEGFSFSQNCTVGNNHGFYPRIGKNVVMHSGSKIVGDCIVGDNVVVSANCYIKDQNVPSNSLVFGSSPKLIIKKRTK